MRLRRIAPAALALLALAVFRPARADVRPPVEVNILGTPRPAVAGQEFSGTLRFSAGAPMRLSNLHISGPDWTLVSSEGLMATLQSGGKVDVPFVAKPAREDEPLVVTWEVDGAEFSKSFDLSPASVRRILEPGKVVRFDRVDPLAQPAPADMPRVGPGPAPAVEKTPAGVRQPGATGNEQINARNITVHGRWLYTRTDGFDIGADGFTVRIWDNDSPFGPELLAQTITDAQGWYSATFFWNPCAVFCDSEPDIYVEFISYNTEYTVKSTAFLAGPYSWATGTTNDYLGTNLDMGWLWPAAEGDQPAGHLLTTLTRGWRFHLGNGFDMTSIDCYWPEGTGGAYYNGAVHFSTGEQWAEGTIIHEQGHHWVSNFGVVIGPDYCNGICDNGGCGHCVWCQETDHDAWAEGFPNWLGEYVMSTFPGVYGRAAFNVNDGRYMLEALGDCGTTDDPYRTENFLGALLHDIQDSPSDDHNGGDAWRDRLALGISQIFTVADLDGPTTPANFLTKFSNRYPAYRENFWETAKNCGYDFDATPPGAVTGLTSPSHSVGGSSPDPTADFTWIRPADDASGVGGYGISITTGGPSIPAAVQNLGNVTSWTSGSLSPGTYWFNIRPVDRAGRWYGSYTTYGPFTVRTPVPANLTTYAWAGWSYPLVPRNVADANFGSVPAPTALDGNTNNTYWTMGGWNNGEQTTDAGFQARLYVDDVWYWWVSWGPIGPGGGYWAPNQGPVTVRGGRHTFEVVHDALDECAETNEGDNGWAHQWVWSPLNITNSALTAYAAPAPRTAGWSSIVDGSLTQYNADGFRFTTDGWWNAITLRTDGADDDYDLRLFSPSTGPADGFNAYTQWSGRVDALDAVLVNRNVVGYSTWDVGAINWDSGVSNYWMEHVRSDGNSWDVVSPKTLAANSSMNLHELYIDTPNTGAVSFVVQITDPSPGATPLKIRWLDNTFTTGNLGGLAGTQTDFNGLARIDTNVPNAGWHCLMVYRETDAGLAPVHYTIRVHRTPPDFIPYYMSGWHSPFVPRDAFDGTIGSVPAPTLLHGDQATTYFNFANINQSPTGAPGLLQHAYEDGVYGWWLAWGAYGPGAIGAFNWNIPWTVRGGRHLLSTIEDPNNDLEEIWETNNAFGQQWVWQPSTVAIGTGVVRGAPPSRTGGWDHGTVGSVYWNADGLRADFGTSPTGYWGALALMPLGSASDFDPRLHEASTGSQNGFASALAQSAFFDGQSDYVLANFNLTGFRAFDVGVVNYGGGDNYRSEVVMSNYLGLPVTGIYGPFNLGPDRILNLHEVYLTAGRWEVDLLAEGGYVDWGLTLHPTDQAYQSKGTAVAGGLAWLNGEDANESVIVDITTPGYYCVGIWKVANTDIAGYGSYRLQFINGNVDAPGTASGATAFRSVFPNPLRSSTSVQFELAREQDATVEVFDLQGARVRTLAAGRRAAGVHRVEWRGDDEQGRAVTPGVYMVRFRSGDRVDQRKVIKLD